MSKIYFVGTCEDEENHFRALLHGDDLVFLKKLQDVPPDARLVSVAFNHKIDAKFLDAHPQLELVATRTTSLDHIDADACRERGICVRNVADYGENTVAEHVFALLLALSRKLRDCYSAVRQGKVNQQALRGFDLFGKTIGILGCGRVGLHVIRIAAGFRMRVLGYDAAPHPFYAELLDFSYADLDRVLAESDILTLHLPLNENTKHILNRDTISRCRKGVVIINTARGGLLDLDAAMEGLESGQVGGLGLDVLEDESVFHEIATNILSRQIAERVRDAIDCKGLRPTPRIEEIRTVVRNHRVLQHPNVVFTPHTAYNSHEAIRRICALTARNLSAFASVGARHGPAEQGR